MTTVEIADPLVQNHSNKDEHNKRLNRLASIGEMSAGIAHEVKNPLTAVKGFLQLANKEKEQEYLSIALSELDNALHTLNDLLQVSKPDLDNEPFSPINLHSELESIISLFQNQFYRVTVDKNFEASNKQIFGQKNALKKAFFNLLKNAFEAIPEQGQISIELFEQNNRLYVYITDTGVGIPEDKLELLGTPFFSTKDGGTGMGLTQVFTTLHTHNADVNVTSQINVGTKFRIVFPVIEKKEVDIIDMENLIYKDGQDFREFILQNKEVFDEILYANAKPVFSQIADSNYKEERLFETAHTIINSMVNNGEHEIILLAKDHGKLWAKNDLPITLKLEWFQCLREVYWDFMYNYYKNLEVDVRKFFKLEKNTNYILDTFTKQFVISYNEYKNEVLHSHREMIEELSVPIIPLSNQVAILPIVGSIDTYRAKRIQEKSLATIEKLKLRKVIIDLSGVAYMDTAVVGHIFKIVDGYKILGCKTIVTGIRSEVANTIIDMGITLDEKLETKADLQHALEEYELA